MLEAQGNCCAICKSTTNYVRSGMQGAKSKGKGWASTKRIGFAGWCVDHDHETNQVRGILCSTCNIAIGAAQDDPDLLITMAAYLQSFKG